MNLDDAGVMPGSQVIQSARRALASYRIRQDGTSQDIVTLPGDALVDLVRSIAMVTRSSTRQITPLSPRDWDPDDFLHVVWRDVARQGRTVERLYVTPHKGAAAELLTNQMELDKASGIESRFLAISDIPDSLTGQVNLQNAWLVDDEAVVREHVSAQGGYSRWTVSCRPSDVSEASTAWQSLWTLAAEAMRRPRVDLEEPLALSADLITGVAPVLCTRDQVDGTSCAWYHGVWQYLRLLDLVSTPTWHNDFYKDVFEELLIDAPASDVLITGTADYSLLAYMLDAARATGTTPHITVVDLCPTPLLACRWYANRVGADVGVLEVDVLELPAHIQNPVDMICSDAFLTRFEAPAQLQVLETWRRLLRDGGHVVTTVRLHALSPGVRSREDEVLDFEARARQRAERWRWFLRKTPDEIADAAKQYALQMTSHDIGTEEEILSRFERAGFRIERREIAKVPGELHATTYLRLVAATAGDSTYAL